MKVEGQFSALARKHGKKEQFSVSVVIPEPFLPMKEYPKQVMDIFIDVLDPEGIGYQFISPHMANKFNRLTLKQRIETRSLGHVIKTVRDEEAQIAYDLFINSNESKPVLWKDKHSRTYESLYLPFDWNEGPKGTIFYENGETRKGFSITKCAPVRLKVLQHIVADGGNIELINIHETCVFFGDENGRYKNTFSNKNQDLYDLVGPHEIYGTVFKFDNFEDTFDDHE